MRHDSRFWLESSGDGVSDAWEDSDGDGAFNIQEFMIGKNPANPHDFLGIQLRVSVEWDATDEELKYIKEAFMIASRYIFDYTDGHAFISKIEIYDNRQNRDYCHVRIHETYADPSKPRVVGFSFIGGYWFVKKYSRYTNFLVPWYCWRNATHFVNFCVVLTPVEISFEHVKEDVLYFAGVLGHELGHYVFWFYDEYKYFAGEYNTIKPWYIVPVMKDYTDEEQQELTDEGLLTVMGLGQAQLINGETMQELSTYEDYRNLKRILGGDKNITAQWFYWSGMGATNASTIVSLLQPWALFRPNLIDASCWASIIYAMNMPGVFIWGYLGIHFVLNGVVYAGFHPSISSYRPLPGPYTMVWLYMWLK